MLLECDYCRANNQNQHARVASAGLNVFKQIYLIYKFTTYNKPYMHICRNLKVIWEAPFPTSTTTISHPVQQVLRPSPVHVHLEPQTPPTYWFLVTTAANHPWTIPGSKISVSKYWVCGRMQGYNIALKGDTSFHQRNCTLQKNSKFFVLTRDKNGSFHGLLC